MSTNQNGHLRTVMSLLLLLIVAGLAPFLFQSLTSEAISQQASDQETTFAQAVDFRPVPVKPQVVLPATPATPAVRASQPGAIKIAPAVVAQTAAPSVVARAKPTPDEAKDAEFDRDVKKLARQYREAPADQRQKLMTQLEAEIEKHFEYRQKQRQKEIDELSNRILSLGVSQRRRQENKTEILKRRFKDLTKPNADLDWDDSNTKESDDSGSIRTEIGEPTSDANTSVVGLSPVEPTRQKPEPMFESVSIPDEVADRSSGTKNPAAKPTAVTPAPKAEEDELTFDGVGYSAWLKMLETERRPAKLAMAIDACSRLAKPEDERKIVRLIFKSVGSVESDGEDTAVRDAGLNALSGLPGDVVVDELLVALRDNSSYRRGRLFQSNVPTQELANLEAPLQKRAEEVIDELLKNVVQGNRDAERMLPAASTIWRQSKRPLEDFPTLRSVILNFVEKRQPFTASAQQDFMFNWTRVVSNVVNAAPKTPNLSVMLVNHYLSDLTDSKTLSRAINVLNLIGQLKQDAAPAVPALVDSFLNHWKLSSLSGLPPISSTATPGFQAFHDQHCSEIIRVLGEIQTGEKGLALLRQLWLSRKSGLRGRGESPQVQFYKAVEKSLQSFPLTDGPKTFVPLLADRSLILGNWNLKSVAEGKTSNGTATVVPEFFKLQLKSQSDLDHEVVATYVLDTEISPKQITIRTQDANSSPLSGIYELTETTLRIHFSEGDSVKIDVFANDENDLPKGHTLLMLERSLDEKLFPNQKATSQVPPAKKAGHFANVISNDFDYAWQTKENYSPPDALKFFPEDADAGAKLATIFRRGEPDFEPNDDILNLARTGMRGLSDKRSIVVRWVGNTYIWGKSPQNPDAVELMYHASDFSGPHQDAMGTRHFAVYFGLSVAEKKTPAILRTLVDLCLKVDDPNDLDRVAWGCSDQLVNLLAVLKPHLSSEDESVRGKAEVLDRIFSGKLKAFEWSMEQTRKRAAEKYADQLPKFKMVLSEGSSDDRRLLLGTIMKEGISLIMDDSFLPAFAKCATDQNDEIRDFVTIIAGDHWIWRAKDQHPDAIQLMLTLSRDESPRVRYNAVYYGLSTVRKKDDDVIRRLLEMAIDDRRNSDIFGRIKWGLQTDKDRTKAVMQEWIKAETTDEARAESIKTLYKELTGTEPPK